MTDRPLRLLVLDDDPWARRLIEHRVRARFPSLSISATAEPAAAPGYDIYLVDNEFDGDRVATGLVAELRRVAPEAAIVVLSAQLDAWTLRRLIASGCNGAFDKCDPDDWDALEAQIEARLQRRPRPRGALGAARGVLEAWSTRLRASEAAVRRAEERS